jgi:predicted permease
VQDPEQLYALRGQFHYPFLRALREQNIFRDVFASAPLEEQDVQIDNRTVERVSLSLVSGNYFSVLGVPPAEGRIFTIDDDQPVQQPVAVLSYRYWERRFGRDPAVVGQSIRIRDTTAIIAGIARRGFFGERVGTAPDLWLPLVTWPRVIPGRNLLESSGTAWLDIVGRRRADLSVTEAEAQLTTLFRRVLAEIFGPGVAEDDRRDIARAAVRLIPADKGLSRLRDQFSGPLYVVFGVVGLMLLIACANVANLLLARAAARRREIGLRLALGIGRFRLVRQLLTENLVLAVLSAMFGSAIAYWGNQLLLKLISANGAASLLDSRVDGRVLVFLIAMTVTTAILFGFAPIFQTARVNLAESLRLTRDNSSKLSTVGSLPLVGQVGVSFILLMGAGLFLQTLERLRAVDLGYTPEHLLILDANPRAAGYQGAAYAAFSNRVLDDFRNIPAVTAVTFSENGALMGRNSGTNRMRPDDFVPGTEGIPHTDFDVVGPRYFATMNIALLAGRDFAESDNVSAEPVVIISQAMAKRFFAGTNPLGRRMLWGIGASERALTVIGVASDVKQNNIRGEEELRFYIPYFQQPTRQLASVRFIVRTSNADIVRGLQQTIRAADPRVPVVSVEKVPVLIDRALAQERMVATLSTFFAFMALVLTCIGVYGCMSYRVARRTNEIGIRMAIGSTAGAVVRILLWEAMRIVLPGLILGVIGSLAASRLVNGMLFAITPYDPTTLFAAAGIMFIVAAAAVYLPARRAARVDPMLALRQE